MQHLGANARSGRVRGGRGRQAVLAAVAAAALWVIVGLVRGPSVATDAFVGFERPRAVSAIETTVIPPFIVQVQGTVTEATGASYPSSQVFLVEPFTGWSLNLSHAGLAPSS